MNVEQRVTANGLWAAVVNVDLQLYKGSIYKLRWGSPGGLDHAIPSYQEARRTIDATDWPEELRDDASQLADRVSTFIDTIKAQDVTSASAQQSRMMSSFEALRDKVRVWPDSAPPSGNGSSAAASAQDSKDPALPGHQEIYGNGM